MPRRCASSATRSLVRADQRADLEAAYILHARPYRESSQLLEVLTRHHGRLGMVARGGLRWSDRREDFRTEVLG